MHWAPATFTGLLIVAGAVWLFCLIACVASFVLGRKPTGNRFIAALLCAAVGMGLAYLALHRVQISYTRTVNNSSWSLNSRYFFLVPIALGFLALLWTLLRRLSLRPPVPAAPPIMPPRPA